MARRITYKRRGGGLFDGITSMFASKPATQSVAAPETSTETILPPSSGGRKRRRRKSRKGGCGSNPSITTTGGRKRRYRRRTVKGGCGCNAK